MIQTRSARDEMIAALLKPLKGFRALTMRRAERGSLSGSLLSVLPCHVIIERQSRRCWKTVHARRRSRGVYTDL